ncbi:MAG TPA: SAM-dependent methyltransferase [Polyangia bacterium]
MGRAGLKLAAALDRFALAPAIKGVHAVDLGASTGGFTQVLLQHGATQVVAVDVGHDQLHAKLRDDARVLNLEGTDWKQLALTTAPGPYDFFTVDVSFVAARSMLRGLAFRLRDGAQGVVLVKPQFELPDHLLRQRDVNDPETRRLALARFTEKAEGLGFRVAAHADSPVAGGEGTIELLTHVVFEGRSTKLPQPGEKRPPQPPKKPARRSGAAALALDGKLSWFAVVTPGTEEVAGREATRLMGDATVTVVPGGVEMTGPVTLGMRANLGLRIPTRLLLRLGQARAREFGKLRHQLARLPWELFLPPELPVRITASASHCRLYHTGAIDETVRGAIADRTGRAPEKAPAEPPSGTSTAPLVLVRGVDDVWTISIDSSGERLNRRGWRTEAGEAPLRETLAAALLEMAEWTPGEALVDPMCGAGTLPIEAATAGLGIAPGLRRAFAFERWPALGDRERAAWDDLEQAAVAAQRTRLDAPIVASDKSAGAVATSRANAARAGVDQHIQLEQRALADVVAPAPTGLFIANPPYGARLGSRRDVPALYREIGEVLRRRFSGWRAAVVVPDVRLASAFRLPLQSSHRLFHGGLSVNLLRFAP